MGGVTGWTEPAVDGYALSELGWVVTAQDIPRAQARLAPVDVPGADGYADATARPGGWPRLAPMDGSLTLVCVGGEEADVDEALTALWLWAGREVEYTPWDRGGLRYRCLWAPQVVERSHLRAEVDGAEVDVVLTMQPAAYGERSEAAVDGVSCRLDVGGTWPTSPRLELTASGGPVSVTHAASGDFASGDFVRLLDDVAEGSKVSVDCAAMEARVNGHPVRVTLQSDWLRLPPGPCTLEVAGATGTVSYVERWA